MAEREITITMLEMDTPEALVAAERHPDGLQLDRLDADDAELFRDAWLAIGAPHEWSSRQSWGPAQWTERLAAPEVEVWLARYESEAAGLAELEFQPHGATEITVFGLLPEFVGRRLGGALLTAAVSRAWTAPRPDGEATTRVHVHTSSKDHAHALPNYLARGFRVDRVEIRRGSEDQ